MDVWLPTFPRCREATRVLYNHGAHAHEGLDLDAMDPRQIVHLPIPNPGGTPVFVGTRVPVDAR